MAYSFMEFISTGTETTATLTFPYLEKIDVKLYANALEKSFSWATDNRITFTAFPSGTKVEIRRKTNSTKPIHDLQAGAPFTRKVFDQVHLQVLYLTQEASEKPYGDVDWSPVVNLRKELVPDSSPLPGSVASIAALRNNFPEKAGQVIKVQSYYDSWAVVQDSVPQYGGMFWYDSKDSSTVDDGFKCIVTSGGHRWKRTRGLYSIGHAGAVEDVNVDSTSYIQKAVDGTPANEELQFIGGPYKFDQIVCSKPITISGSAALTHNGIRIKTSNFTSALSGKQTCWMYQSSSRAFFARAYEDDANYSSINILYNNFSGFFYSTDMRGREYAATPNDPANRVFKGTSIIGCTSIAPSGVPAGHFQHTGITNAKCIACSAYGGINATSYNFINGNGFIVVDSCYDENNTYGSLEIENNRVSFAVVSNNIFGKTLWIDDTSNVTVTGNVVADRIFITAQSNDTDNININGNVCARISVSKFGTGPTGRHKSVHINGNTCYGEAGSNDIFADDSVDYLTVEANSLNGADGSAVAMVRSANCNHLVRNNRSRVYRAVIASGTGGRIVEYGNDNTWTSGIDESKHVSNLLKPVGDYLDLPGKYLHGTKYSGEINPGATGRISLGIPDSEDLAFRGVSLWVMVRNATNNDVGTYRLDCIYRVVGNTIALTFGTKYSDVGTAAASIAVSDDSSTKTQIKFAFKNNSATAKLQVTVMPEVSSRFGTEA